MDTDVTQTAQTTQTPELANVPSVEPTFTNNRLYGRVRWYDFVFIFATFFVFVIFGTIIFLIAWFLHAPDSYLTYPIIVFLWGIFIGLGMLKRDNKRTWIYFYKWLRFQNQNKNITPDKFQGDFFIKSIARKAYYDSQDEKYTFNDTDECNIFLYGFGTGDNADECAIAYKVDIDGIDSYTDMQTLYGKLSAMNDFLVNLKNLNKKRDFAFDLVFWNSQEQDTSDVLKQLDVAEKTKTNIASILLIEEKKAFYRNPNEFLTPENQPSFFNFYDKPVNLKNHYFVFMIKGSTYSEAKHNADEFSRRFEEIGPLKPLNWADVKSMFGTYFRGVQFAEEKPVNETPVPIGDDLDDNGEYWRYNITNNAKNDTLQTQSALDYIVNIENKQSHLKLKFNNGETLYVAVRGFIDLPNRFNLGWMLPFQESNIGVMITQKFSIERAKSFNRRQLRLMKENNRKWQRTDQVAVSDPYANQTLFQNVNDSVNFAQQINNGVIGMLNYRYYIVFQGQDSRELEGLTHEFDDLLNRELQIGNDKKEHYTFDQYEGFLSAFPSASDVLRRRRYDQNYISTLAVAQGWPFVKNTTFLQEGTFIGIQVDSGNLAIVNDIQQGKSSAFHTGVFASTGSGKTKLMQHMILDYCTYQRPVKVICVDPNGDYQMMTKNLGGQQYNTDANKLTVNPVLETVLIKDKPKLMAEYADKLIRYRLNTRPVVSKQELIMRGEGLWWTIEDTEITPDKFEDSIRHRMEFTEIDKQRLKELYTAIYLKCVGRMTIDPFAIIDLVGPTYDLLSRKLRYPSAFEVYNEFVKSLTNFFKYLIVNNNFDQMQLIGKAIQLTYKNVCSINVAVDPYSGESFLTRDGTKRSRIDYDDLLKMDHYPVFNDFYEWFEIVYHEEMRRPDTHSQIKLQYERLDSILRQFIYYDDGNEVHKGVYSDYWNTESERINLDSNYTDFITDNISNGLKSPQDTSGLPSVNEYTIAKAQMFLLWSVIKARVARNGQEKFDKKADDQPFIRVLIDETHNIIKDKDIRSFILGAVKEWRKYNAGVTLLTQNLTDILLLPDGDGEGIMEQLPNKFLLGTTMRGLNAYIDYLKPFPVSKRVQMWLTNPKNLSSTVLHEDENPHPPGIGIASLKNNDQSQVCIKFGYTEFSGMITGSNDFQGGVPIDQIMRDILNGYWPISSHDDRAHPRPVPNLIRNVVVDADRVYHEQLNNKVIRATMQLKIQTENNNLAQEKLPTLDLQALTDFGDYGQETREWA